MAVHLYGVLEAGASPPSGITGLDARPVRALPLRAGSAWVSDVTGSTLEATPQRLRDHDAVLRVAVEAGYSIVPSLFGRLHANDESLGAALETSAPALEAAMELVRDRVEMSFLVASSGIAAESDIEGSQSQSPGRDHLRRIQKQVHAERLLLASAVELAQSATRVLGGLLVAERVVEHPALPIVVARAHLVARDNIARYLRAVKLQASGAGPALRVVVRGPGAAYSFAAVQVG